MTTKPKAVNELKNTNLLFVRIRCCANRHTAISQKTLIAGDMLKLLTNRRVKNIATLVAIHTGKLVKVTAPLFRNGIGIYQVGFKKLFNIGQISTLYVGSLPQLLHDAFVHFE